MHRAPHADADKPSVHDFVAARLDRNYAAAHRTLSEARARLPTFAPTRVLEFGAGLAPVTWAARAVWPELHPLSVAVEPNHDLRHVAAELITAAGEDPPHVSWQATLPATDDAPFDLVSAAFCLDALPVSALRSALVSLWARTAVGGLLTLLHPATPAGFSTTLTARELLGVGGVDGAVEHARIISPCPHAGRCPLAQGDAAHPWEGAKGAKHRRRPSACYAEQKVVESSARQYAERARRRGRERRNAVERYSYLIVQRLDGASGGHDDAHASDGTAEWGRIVRPPRVRSKHVMLDVCTAGGEVVQEVVSKGKYEQPAYRRSRKAHVGDAWHVCEEPEDEEAPDTTGASR